MPAALRILFACALAAAPGCGKKRSENTSRSLPAIEGLAAVPASATVVIGADVEALAGSELVRRAVAAMFERDPELEHHLEQLAAECHIDPRTDVSGITIGMGPEPDQVVLIAAGKFDEATLSSCLHRRMSAGGGSFTTKTSGGRVFYLAREGDRSVWLTMGGGGTLALSPSQPWLEQAVGPGSKAGDNATLMDAIQRIGEGRTLWAAGLVPAEVGNGLIDATRGQIEERPRAMFGDLSLDGGVSARLGVVMASAEDAKTLESKAVFELALGSLVAQEWGLGPLVARTRARAEGAILQIDLRLSEVEVNELLTALGNAEVDTRGVADKDPASPEPGTQE